MYKVNYQNAQTRLLAEIGRLNRHKLSLGEITGEAAKKGRELIANRVQNLGLNTAGQPMKTLSRGVIGAYSARWGNRRRSAGKQTQYIDLTFSGEMMRDYKVSPSGPTSARLQFDSQTQEQKAAQLQGYFGECFAFAPMEAEAADKAAWDKSRQILITRS